MGDVGGNGDSQDQPGTSGAAVQEALILLFVCIDCIGLLQQQGTATGTALQQHNEAEMHSVCDTSTQHLANGLLLKSGSKTYRSI
jgi:hypothetical protein